MTSPTPFFVVLRQNLVCWRFDAQLADLVRSCEEYGIDEVLLMPHQCDVFDSPAGYFPLDVVRADCELMVRAKEALAKVGVRMGLNVWHTLGHGDRGRDMTGAFPFQPLVDPEGRSCRAGACPLSPEWQAYMTTAFEGYAAVRPSRIFLDDDFRWSNHSTVGGGGQMTCFCPLHLAAFNRRHGRNFTREALVREVLRPGTPSPVRGQWLDFLRDMEVETAGRLGDVVRRVSPETEMGLMSGYPDFHAAEGRDWGKLIEALCGRGRRGLLRPHYPDYLEGWQRDVPKNLFVLRHSLAQLPREGMLHFPEIDNCLPTPFNRSPDYLAMQTVLCAALGLGQFHYNLFEFVGNPDTFSENREYGEMLRRIRPHVDHILEITAGAKRECGVRFLNHPRAAYAKPLVEGRDWLELRVQPFAMGGSLAMSSGLQWLGFPVTFDESAVVAVCGALLETITDAQIESLLAKSLLLDSTAAEVLLHRGFGPQIGLISIRHGAPERAVITGEKIIDATDPHCGSYVRCRGLVASRQTFFTALPAAQRLTTMVGCEGEEQGSGTVLFQNERGGRVGTLNATAGEFDDISGHHLTPLRQHLMGRMLDFLYGPIPHVSVRGAPLAFPLHVALNDGSALVAVGNVRSSAARRMQVVCRHLPVADVEGWRFVGGELLPASVALEREGDTCRLTANDPLPPLGILILKLK